LTKSLFERVMESWALKTSWAFWTIAAFVVEWVLSCASVKTLTFDFVLADACAGLGFTAQEA